MGPNRATMPPAIATPGSSLAWAALVAANRVRPAFEISRAGGQSGEVEMEDGGMQGKAMMLLGLLAAAVASAHQNDSGMNYSAYRDARGLPCCNNADCRPASDFADVVVNGQPMVRLLIDGAWYSVLRYFVVAEDATDGRAHWCGKTIMPPDGGPRPAPVCVILPPRDM